MSSDDMSTEARRAARKILWHRRKPKYVSIMERGREQIKTGLSALQTKWSEVLRKIEKSTIIENTDRARSNTASGHSKIATDESGIATGLSSSALTDSDRAELDKCCQTLQSACEPVERLQKHLDRYLWKTTNSNADYLSVQSSVGLREAHALRAAQSYRELWAVPNRSTERALEPNMTTTGGKSCVSDSLMTT